MRCIEVQEGEMLKKMSNVLVTPDMNVHPKGVEEGEIVEQGYTVIMPSRKNRRVTKLKII